MTSNIQKAFKTKSKLRAMVDGGKVKGKGGPTDDKVGPVMLSDGEYVLPADTVEIVGRDKLDALRLATHDFVDDDNKPKVSGLRKMANGGPFYVDPEGVASRQLPPGRAVVPYQPPRATIEGTASSVPPTAAAAPPAATSSLRTTPVESPQGLASRVGGAVGRTTSVVRRAAGGMAATAPLAGFGDYKADTGGVDTSASGTLGYLLKGEFGNAGASLSGGAAEALADSGRGVAKTADWVAGLFGANPDLTGKYDRAVNDLFGGYLSLRNPKNVGPADSAAPEPSPPATAGQPSRPAELPGMNKVPADVRTSSAGMPATPVQPQSYQNRRLAEMGVPVDQQNLAPVTEDTRRSLLREGRGTPGQYVNLGSYGGDTNIYGTASKPGGRIGTFVGVGASARPGGSGPQEDPIMGEIRSALRSLTDGAGNRGGGGGSGNADAINAINARYDALLRAGSGRNIVRGLDWSQRHGLDLERARALELGELARNQSALRGQDLQAATAANNADMQARMQALQTLSTMANQRSQQNAQAQAAMLKALQEAQTAARQGEEKGFERYTRAISSMFIGPDGKPDAAEQERFTSFLQASDPKAFEKFTAMSPQDQMVLLQNFKTLYDMNKARNATAERGRGAITNRADMPVDIREATWNDYWNNNLPLADYIWSNLPFTNPNVVVTESGQPVLMSDYATTDGNWDADKLKLIRQRTGKDRHGRSALRGD